jgi:hypothetical protein
LIITPASANTVSITTITVEKLTDNTGDVTVDGNLRVRSQLNLNVPYSINYPAIRLGTSGTGIGALSISSIAFITVGVLGAYTSSSHPYFTAVSLGIGGTDTTLYRDAANTLALRNSTSAQTFRVYTSYTSASSYERFAVNTAAGQITLAAEMADAGTDNVDLSLLPAGTGGVLSIFKEVNVATDTTLTTAAQVSGVQYNNYGQAANVTLGLPAISAGKSFRVVLGTTAAYYWRVDPNGTDTAYLDGVSTGAGKYIGVSSAAAGNELVCKSAQTGASSYAWFCSTISGSWAQES